MVYGGCHGKRGNAKHKSLLMSVRLCVFVCVCVRERERERERERVIQSTMQSCTKPYGVDTYHLSEPNAAKSLSIILSLEI